MPERHENLIYKKHNSFKEIRRKNGHEETEVLRRIIATCAREDLRNLLTKSDQDILSKVTSDLNEPTIEENLLKFRLSPFVIHEIETLPDAQVPKYLVHRYRYEIFPFLNITDDYPPYLQIEPTSRCNYRCIFCYQTDSDFTSQSTGQMGNMSLDLFRRIIDQAEGNIEFVSLASRGEPLLCPGIEDMLAYTPGKFLNLKMNTNASLLDERKCHAILQSGIKTLVFSADAADETLYSRLRVGGKLSQVIRNVERFQKIRKTQYKYSTIITRVSGVKYSEDQSLDSMERTWGDFVDQVAFVAYNPWENVYLRPSSDMEVPCSDLWRRMFVWWDGRVNPCDVDYKSTLSVGSASNTNLSALWKFEAYDHLRSKHISASRRKMNPCKRCSVV